MFATVRVTTSAMFDLLSGLMMLQLYPDTVQPIANNDAYYPVTQAQNCMCNTVGTYNCT